MSGPTMSVLFMYMTQKRVKITVLTATHLSFGVKYEVVMQSSSHLLYELFANSILEELLRVDLYHTHEGGLH